MLEWNFSGPESQAWDYGLYTRDQCLVNVYSVDGTGITRRRLLKQIPRSQSRVTESKSLGLGFKTLHFQVMSLGDSFLL